MVAEQDDEVLTCTQYSMERWMEVGTKGTELRSIKSTRPGKERKIEKLE